MELGYILIGVAIVVAAILIHKRATSGPKGTGGSGGEGDGNSDRPGFKK